MSLVGSSSHRGPAATSRPADSSPSIPRNGSWHAVPLSRSVARLSPRGTGSSPSSLHSSVYRRCPSTALARLCPPPATSNTATRSPVSPVSDEQEGHPAARQSQSGTRACTSQQSYLTLTRTQHRIAHRISHIDTPASSTLTPPSLIIIRLWHPTRLHRGPLFGAV